MMVSVYLRHKKKLKVFSSWPGPNIDKNFDLEQPTLQMRSNEVRRILFKLEHLKFGKQSSGHSKFTKKIASLQVTLHFCMIHF